MALATFMFIDDHTHPSKGDLARALYPGETFDTALPWEWHKRCLDSGFEDSASHFVWLYPSGDLLGRPAPLTARGIEILALLSMRAGA